MYLIYGFGYGCGSILIKTWCGWAPIRVSSMIWSPLLHIYILFCKRCFKPFDEYHKENREWEIDQQPPTIPGQVEDQSSFMLNLKNTKNLDNADSI